MFKEKKMIKATIIIGLLILLVPAFVMAQATPTFRVNCDRGQSVQSVLDRLSTPATIVVTGTCHEYVRIKNDDVTIQGGTYRTPTPSDPKRSTIVVQGARRVLITGGAKVQNASYYGVVVIQGGSLSLDYATVENSTSNGLAAAENSALFLTNSTIQGNGKSGVVVISSSSARIGQDISGNRGKNTIQNNGGSGVAVIRASSALIDGNDIFDNLGHGVSIEGSSATVINNEILRNHSKGVNVSSSSHARIGINDSSEAGPNHIANNFLEGIQSGNGGAAYIYANTIENNGYSESPGRAGVGIYRASGRLLGGNIIRGNGGRGVEVDQGSLFQGVGDFILTPTPPRDEITDNTRSGILAWNSASLDLQSVNVTNNGENGIEVSLKSTLRIYDATVSGNDWNGIELYDGSSVARYSFNSPRDSITGNSNWGIICHSDSKLVGVSSNVTGNSIGQVSCPGF